jgi:hypothetical protein
MFPVQFGTNAPDLILNLTPMATITGHVSVSNGAEPGELYFQAYRAEYRLGRVRWNVFGQAKTDSNGTFRFYDLDAPAKYLLCSQQKQEQRGIPSSTRVVYGYPTTCYPSSLGTDSEGLLLLAPGQHADIELSIAREPFHRVSIAVSSPQGQHAGVNIYAHDGKNISGWGGWKEEDQTWDAWLPNGMYYAESRAWDQSSASYGRVDFKVADTALNGVRMAVLPLSPVEVIIHKLFTDPPPNENSHGYVIRTGTPQNQADPGLQLELIPLERRLEGGGGGIDLNHADDEPPDHFQAMNVTPGRYWVYVSWVSTGYVSAITSGGTDLTREPLVVGEGNTVPPIEVTVRNDGGSLDCTIKGLADSSLQTGRRMFGGPLPSSPMVAAFPIGPRYATFPQTSLSDPNGTVRLDNLPPGLYRLITLSKFRDLDSEDPAEIAELMAKGKLVRIEAGSTTSVQLELGASGDSEPNP